MTCKSNKIGMHINFIEEYEKTLTKKSPEEEEEENCWGKPTQWRIHSMKNDRKWSVMEFDLLL